MTIIMKISCIICLIEVINIIGVKVGIKEEGSRREVGIEESRLCGIEVI